MYKWAVDCVQSFDTKLVDFLAGFSRQRARVLAERSRHRQQGGRQWFTLDEYRLVDVLASLIVPSDEDGPGAKEAGVGEKIDQWVAASAEKQTVYARGLLALDEWALRDCDCTFAQLTVEQQLDLLRQADQFHHEWSSSGSNLNKMKTRLLVRYYKVNGFFWAVELFQRLVADVLRAFYSSRVCWDWLGYDGPPMPYGYSDLLEKRSPAPKLELETRTADGGGPVDQRP